MARGLPYTLARAANRGAIAKIGSLPDRAKKDSIYLPMQPSILLERFESANGYVKAALGTLVQDTTDFVTGNQSIKITTDGAGGVVTVTKTYGASVNISNSYLMVRCKISSWANMQEFSLYLSNDAGFTNWSSINLGSANDGQTYHYLEDGIWQNLVLDLGNLQTGGGTFNPAALLTIRIRAVDKNSTPISVWVDEISTMARLPKGIVVLTADDGWAVQDTAMRPILDKYGFRPTCYIIPDAVGTTNYLTLNAIKRLQHINRWEMGLHHQTNLASMKASEGIAAVERVIQFGIEYGLVNGFNGIGHFALPNGAFDQSILDLMKQYFKTSAAIIYGQSSSFPYLETCPFGDLYKVRRFDVRSNHTPTTINNLIDRIATQQSVGIFNWHKIVSTTPGDITEYLNTDFQTIIDHLALANVMVMTMGELYTYMLNRIV